MAAKILSQNKDAFAGTIKFVFQPNEEIAGALRMIDEGVLDHPSVDAVMGLHVWTPVPSGKIGITAGPVMGGLDVFKMTIFGKGGHTGVPEDAVDPVIAAANLIQTVQAIQTREISQLKSTIIMFGRIAGGTKSNIIPDKVELEGSIRFLYKGGPDSVEQPTERFIRVAEQVCRTHRCTCEIDIVHENIPLINDPRMTALARDTAASVFGGKRPSSTTSPSPARTSRNSASASRASSCFSVPATTAKGNHPFPPSIRVSISMRDVLTDGVAMHVHGALNYFNTKESRFKRR